MNHFAEWQRQQKAIQERSREGHRAAYQLIKARKAGIAK